MRSRINENIGEINIGISVFKAMDYLFCPRIVYYDEILGISENKNADFKKKEEDRRNAINRLNKKWIWDRLKTKRDLASIFDSVKYDVLLCSKKNNFYGVIDEVLTLKDDSMVPLYFIDSKYNGRIHNFYKYQMAMYSMLMEENYNIESKLGYILFTGNLSKLEKITYTEEDFRKIEEDVQKILEIIRFGKYPLEVEGGTKCRNCYYKKICGR